jgi:recombination protein RecT
MEQNKAPQKAQDKNLATMDLKTLILTIPKKQFLASGGDEEQFNREAGFALQLFDQNPFLGKMDRLSIVYSIVNVALTGLTLNPELKLGYLVPRKGKLYFQSSYMGKREILFQAGIVKDIWVSLVHENDPFEYFDGDVREIKHTPDPFLSVQERGEIIGGYWVAILQNNTRMMGTMSRERIEQIKARSEAVKAKKGSPWDTDPLEMMKKTIINAAFKDLPKLGISEHVLKAMKADSQVDDEDLKDFIEQQEAGQEHDLDNDSPATDEVIDTEAEVIDEINEETTTKKDPKPATGPDQGSSAGPAGSNPAQPGAPGKSELNFKPDKK